MHDQECLSNLEAYDYWSMDAENEIRLLTVYPADSPTDPLSCSLTHHSRRSAPEYEALSYTWGDRELPKTVICDGRRLEVTANCESALRTLRSAGASVVWVDAICIDQGDASERSSQVAIKGEIFRHAKRTLIYLGEIGEVDDRGVFEVSRGDARLEGEGVEGVGPGRWIDEPRRR